MMFKLLEMADKGMSALNKCLVLLGSIALMAAALILTYSVVSRGLFHLANDWQDEAALFCLVGVTFMCSSYVQEKRGHIGISAIEGLLPHKVNQVRATVIDIISCLFFAFFSVKTWDLLVEAWVDGQVTNSHLGSFFMDSLLNDVCWHGFTQLPVIFTNLCQKACGY